MKKQKKIIGDVDIQKLFELKIRIQDLEQKERHAIAQERKWNSEWRSAHQLRRIMIKNLIDSIKVKNERKQRNQYDR